jgi:hypothetical protein
VCVSRVHSSIASKVSGVLVGTGSMTTGSRKSASAVVMPPASAAPPALPPSDDVPPPPPPSNSGSSNSSGGSGVRRVDSSVAPPAGLAALLVNNSNGVPPPPPFASSSEGSVPSELLSPQGSPRSVGKKEKKRTHKRITLDMIDSGARDGSDGAPSPAGSLSGNTALAALNAERERLDERMAELAKRETELDVGDAALKKQQVKLKRKESEMVEREEDLKVCVCMCDTSRSLDASTFCA